METKLYTTDDAEGFQQSIQQHYPKLSRRLQQLARFLLENPERIVLCTVAELSSEAGVPPSTVIRFANAMGFSGFSGMRKAVRSQLHYTGSYAERVQSAQQRNDQCGVLSRVVESSTMSLNAMEQSVSEQDLMRTVSLIQQADTVYVMGVRKAHPVATYLAYGLWQLDRRCVLLGGGGGLHREEAAGIRRTDLVFLVSYHPYGGETLWMQEHAQKRFAQLITLTDNKVSPIAEGADQSLYVLDANIDGVRGLSTSMSLVQTIILSLAETS